MATRVKFLVHRTNGELYAFFPQLRHSFNGYRYDNKVGIIQRVTSNGIDFVKVPIGIEYLQHSRNATKNEFKDFKAKLIHHNLLNCV